MQPVHSLDDPRISAYRNLRDRTLRGESLFIAEGPEVVRRLLRSRHGVDSVLVAESWAGDFSDLAAGPVPVFVGPDKLLSDIVGFTFHQGVLAAGRRSVPPALDELVASIDARQRLSLAICPEITKPENLGLVFRSAAGFGFDGVVLGRQCCDPLSRRALRVSMGATLSMPWIRCADLPADLQRLERRWGFELFATVLDAGAERLTDVRWPSRVALVMGNEFYGLRSRWLDLCPRRVTIPMAPDVDSLNLGVAAGVFMYQIQRRP